VVAIHETCISCSGVFWVTFWGVFTILETSQSSNPFLELFIDKKRRFEIRITP